MIDGFEKSTLLHKKKNDNQAITNTGQTPAQICFGNSIFTTAWFLCTAVVSECVCIYMHMRVDLSTSTGWCLRQYFNSFVFVETAASVLMH